MIRDGEIVYNKFKKIKVVSTISKKILFIIENFTIPNGHLKCVRKVHKNSPLRKGNCGKYDFQGLE